MQRRCHAVQTPSLYSSPKPPRCHTGGTAVNMSLVALLWGGGGGGGGGDWPSSKPGLLPPSAAITTPPPNLCVVQKRCSGLSVPELRLAPSLHRNGTSTFDKSMCQRCICDRTVPVQVAHVVEHQQLHCSTPERKRAALTDGADTAAATECQEGSFHYI